MKTLAVQAGSGQLRSTERGMLNTEYQALISEVTRIAAATEFNGQQLVNGSLALGGAVTTVAASNFGKADGVANITGRGLTTSTADNYTLTYNNTTRVLTLAGPGTESYTGTIDASAVSGTGTNTTMITGTAVRLTQNGNSNDIVVSINTAFQAGTEVTASTNNAMRFSGTSTTTFSYKVGTGTDALKDVINVSLAGISAANLGLAGSDITTTASADQASVLLSEAIDQLNIARSSLGAYQNRLEFASANIASAIENTEAARSNLLDLDIAAEMSKLTAKQVLVQAGVAMLAQANQMPQNLLKLFQ
jgi:flagellin